MAKQQPAWKQNGTEAPPVDLGYWDYGTVYRTEQGPQRESLRHAWGIAWWSWKYWGKKVRRDFRIVRERKRAARRGSHPLG